MSENTEIRRTVTGKVVSNRMDKTATVLIECKVKHPVYGKYIRRSTRKTRLVTQAIVGRPVEEAAAILQFMPQGAARDVAKVLKSATANAENNHDLPADELFVAEATANEGPTIKRWRPRAQGRAFPINKPMTHVTVVVENREA